MRRPPRSALDRGAAGSDVMSGRMMRAADYLIDIGPLAGINGGRLVFAGTPSQLHLSTESLTADYLTGKRHIHIPAHRRKAINLSLIHIPEPTRPY